MTPGDYIPVLEAALSVGVSPAAILKRIRGGRLAAVGKRTAVHPGRQPETFDQLCDKGK